MLGNVELPGVTIFSHDRSRDGKNSCEGDDCRRTRDDALELMHVAFSPQQEAGKASPTTINAGTSRFRLFEMKKIILTQTRRKMRGAGEN